MALKIPVIPQIAEADQLLSWEAELEARWSQLQVRRRRAEQLREKQILLEATLRELDNENVAAGLILEERRRALSARQAQHERDAQAQREQTVQRAATAAAKQHAVEDDALSIDAAWRALEVATQQADATHAEEMRALQWAKQRATQREAEVRGRLDTLREREAQLLTRADALMHRKRHSAELIRQTLTQLQRELDVRQSLLERET